MSFFADLIGSVAESGAKGLGEISARNQREDEARLQNDLAIERSKAAEAIRLDMEEKQRQAKQQRISEQNQAVEKATPAVTAERELSSAQKLAPSVDGNVMDIIKSRLSPEQMTKFYGVDNSPTAVIDDGLKAARQGGMYEAEDQLKEQRKITVAAVEAARKVAREEFKDADTMRRTDIQEQNANTNARRVEQAIAKVSGGGSSGNTDLDKKVKLLKLAGRTDSQIADFITEKKQGSVQDLAADFLKTDPNAGLRNALTTAQAISKAKELIKLTDGDDAPAAAPKPAALAAGKFKAGDTRVIAGGPNKGKTAVYDGTGWALK